MRELDESEIEHHLSQIEEHGFSVVEDAFDPDTRSALKAALNEIEREHGFGYSDTTFEGTKTVRIYNLLAYHSAFEQIPVASSVLPIVERVLDNELLLSSLSAICLGPGQDAQVLHADTNMIPLPRPHLPITVNCMWAISDFTEANGATRFVPGSHHFDHDPVYGQHYDTVCAEMRAGSVLIFNSTLWHGGGENTTDERRDGIANYYCAGWLRQQENQQLGISPDRAMTFERRLQELCGYSVYRGIYGHVENTDPIVMLGQEQTRGMVWQASDRRRDSALAADGREAV